MKNPLTIFALILCLLIFPPATAFAAKATGTGVSVEWEGESVQGWESKQAERELSERTRANKAVEAIARKELEVLEGKIAKENRELKKKNEELQGAVDFSAEEITKANSEKAAAIKAQEEARSEVEERESQIENYKSQQTAYIIVIAVLGTLLLVSIVVAIATVVLARKRNSQIEISDADTKE